MKSFLKYILPILFTFSLAIAHAQNDIAISKDSVFIGEPFTISIKASQTPINTNFSDINQVELLKIDTTKDANGAPLTFHFLFTTFDSGQIVIPINELIPNIEGQLSLFSKGIPSDSTYQYSDPKEIINMERTNQVPYFIILGLITLLGIFVILALIKKLKVQHIPADATLINDYSNFPSISNQNLHELLQQLKQDWNNEKINSEQLGNSLMRYLGQFLWNKGYHVYTKTGNEIILFTRSIYDQSAWQKIKDTVQLSNYLKFGKYTADKEDGLAAINNVIEIIISDKI